MQPQLADLLALAPGAVAALEPDAGDLDRSLVGSSRKFTQRSSVYLPEPERPKITTTSPWSHLQVDAAQHLEVAEALVQPVDADDHVVGLRHASRHPCRSC